MKKILATHPEWINMPVDKYRVITLCKHAISERMKCFHNRFAPRSNAKAGWRAIHCAANCGQLPAVQWLALYKGSDIVITTEVIQCMYMCA